MPKVTLPISHEAGVTTAESWSVWLQAHTLPTLLYLGAAGKRERWGEEGSLYSEVRGVCPHKPRAFFVSYLHVKAALRGLLMEHFGSHCKSRGMKGKEDNGWFL